MEILLSFVLVILSMTVVIMLVFGSQAFAVDAQTDSEATHKAQAMLENARATAIQNYDLVVSIPVVTDGIYSKTLTVVDVDSFTKQVTANVTWTGEHNRSLGVQLVTIVTNPIAAAGGSTCSPILTGDWTAPQVYGYVDFPSSAGGSGLNVIGPKAYVVSDPKSAGTDDFYVINVSDPTQKPLPILGHFSTTYGLTDVRTIGKYSFVTADSAAFQFLAIDVSDPTTLNASKIVKKIDLTSAGDSAYGNTIFYANKKVYVGLTNSTGPEFRIIDVSDPNPANWAEVGPGYEVGGAVNKIVVKNNIAYLATAGPNETIALDVSNPSSPVVLSAYASVTLTGQSLALDSTNNTLYFGKIGGTGNPKLLAFNSANLAAAPKWTYNMVKQSGVYTMVLRSNLVFMTTADPSDGLQIWDVSNPSGPPVRHDTSPLNIQQGATAGSDCAGNLLFVAQRSNRAMQIVGPYVPPVFDYTLSTPSDVTVTRGGSSQNTTFTTTLASGSTQAVTFTNSALPSGVSVSYSSTSCSPTCNTTLTFTASAGATLGTVPVTITGSPLSHSVTFNLTVNAPFDYTMSNSGPITAPKNSTGSNTITVTLVSGATTPVTLNVSGLPAHTSVQSLTPGVCNPTCSATLTIKALNSANSGTYPITVSGSPNGTGPRSTTVNLIIP